MPYCLVEGSSEHVEGSRERLDKSSLDYFVGGVPAGEYFRATLEMIRNISAQHAESRTGIDPVHELCLVGVVSYFEAFCKDHFAALVNLTPQLIVRLKERGHDVSIDGEIIAMYGDDVASRLGFFIAEKYDFGSAKKINALFGALLTATPFSKEKADRYSRLLADRNLLVHHGGTYTLRHLMMRSELASSERLNWAFSKSRRVVHADVLDAVEFLGSIARQTIQSTHDALLVYIENSGLYFDQSSKEALDLMQWWDA